MKAGIIFIWSEKEILGKLLKVMEEKGFFYIENFVIALLDASKLEIEPKTVLGVEGSSVCSDTTSTTESPAKGEAVQENAVNEKFLQEMGNYMGVEANNLLYDGKAE